MKISEMMHPGVEWVSPDTPVTALAQKMLECDIGAIPVGHDDHLIGMVTDRDITVRGVAKAADVSTLTAKDVMTIGVIWSRDSDHVDAAERIMESKEVRRPP